MSKPPWFKFYSADWLSSSKIRSLTLEEKGLFVDMMAVSWQETPPGTLPVDKKILAIILGRNTRQLSSKSVRNLLELWPETDGRLVNKKMYEIGQELENKHAKLSEAGKRGNQKRWGGDSGGDSPSDRNPDSETDTDTSLTTYPRGNSTPPASGPAQKKPPGSLEECKPWQSRETAHFLKNLSEIERTEKYPTLVELGFHVDYIKSLIGPS